jgi:hypothetical protein
LKFSTYERKVHNEITKKVAKIKNSTISEEDEEKSNNFKMAS